MTKPRRRRGRTALLGIGALALASTAVALVEYLGDPFLSGRPTGEQPSPPTTPAPPGEQAREIAVMSLHDAPKSVPELVFRDGGGRPVSLAEFRGRVVLLNIWATWCGPCRREMPTLDRLQAELGGPDFQVLALSIDRAGLGVVSEFYNEIGIIHLPMFIDKSNEVSRQLNVVGLPTTLLIDRDGREIARHVGPAEWDTPEMVAFFQRQTGRESGSLWPESAGKEARVRTQAPALPSAPPRDLSAARLPLAAHTMSFTNAKENFQ